MFYSDNVWEYRNTNREKALLHTSLMDSIYANEIAVSVGGTKIYNKNSTFEVLPGEKNLEMPELSFMNDDTVTALFKCSRGFQTTSNTKKIAILNFASFKNPGGRFIDGSFAQEEALCHMSFLYNVLRSFQSEYDENKKHLHGGLYEDWALYSPDVVFEEAPSGKNNTAGRSIAKADVITCPAPNKSLIRYKNFTEAENTIALCERARFIKNIAEKNNVDILILGAWGCGVFQQDPDEVANMFKEIFLCPSNIQSVVFAVPGNNRNVDAFKKIIND